jgi:hypothetical protein
MSQSQNLKSCHEGGGWQSGWLLNDHKWMWTSLVNLVVASGIAQNPRVRMPVRMMMVITLAISIPR